MATEPGWSEIGVGHLPDDVVCMIVALLSPAQRVDVACVCKAWRELAFRRESGWDMLTVHMEPIDVPYRPGGEDDDFHDLPLEDKEASQHRSCSVEAKWRAHCGRYPVRVLTVRGRLDPAQVGPLFAACPTAEAVCLPDAGLSLDLFGALLSACAHLRRLDCRWLPYRLDLSSSPVHTALQEIHVECLRSVPAGLDRYPALRLVNEDEYHVRRESDVVYIAGSDQVTIRSLTLFFPEAGFGASGAAALGRILGRGATHRLRLYYVPFAADAHLFLPHTSAVRHLHLFHSEPALVVGTAVKHMPQLQTLRLSAVQTVFHARTVPWPDLARSCPSLKQVVLVGKVLGFDRQLEEELQALFPQLKSAVAEQVPSLWRDV